MDARNQKEVKIIEIIFVLYLKPEVASEEAACK